MLRSPNDQVWIKIQFRRHSWIKVFEIGTFVNQKKIIGTVSSISEKLRSKDQRPSSPHDQIWAKLQFGSITAFKCTRWQFLSINYSESAKYFENFRVKDQGHQMTKYGQKCSFGTITHFNVAGSNFCQLKTLIGAVLSISENLRSKVKVTT